MLKALLTFYASVSPYGFEVSRPWFILFAAFTMPWYPSIMRLKYPVSILSCRGGFGANTHLKWVLGVGFQCDS